MSVCLSRLRLHLTPGIGYKTYLQLTADYTEDEIFSLPFSELEKIPGIGPKKAAGLKDIEYLEQAKRELEQIEKQQIRLISLEELPPLLSMIPDPPLFLYVKGIFPREERGITMVGTRKCSKTGRFLAFSFAQQFVQAGLVVVSGLAEGIDTSAHYGALSEGKTIAVLGSGLNQIYPRSNLKLAHQIVEQGGTLLTEFPLEQFPQKINFPRRNRILAGLTDAVLLVEAPEKSGALITVEFALNYGRNVFVVPGSVLYASCRGSNLLLQEGATPCLDPQDILLEYGLGKNISNKIGEIPDSFSPLEKQVYTALKNGKQSLEELQEETGLTEMPLIRILGSLEMQGWVQSRLGQYVLSQKVVFKRQE